jgi:hypothetical protein
MTMMDELYQAKLDEIDNAIRTLARRPRRPQDLAVLIEAGDRALELLAGADMDELDDADGDAALALSYVAGLALMLRRALRHHAGVHVVVRPRREGVGDEAEPGSSVSLRDACVQKLRVDAAKLGFRVADNDGSEER